MTIAHGERRIFDRGRDKPITIERIERALIVVAGAVAMPGGEVYVPIFERIERELADRRSATDAVARARSLLNRSGS